MNLQRPYAAYSLCLLLAACSSNSDAPTDHPDGEQDLSNVIYVGGVTDEALEQLIAVPSKNDPRYTAVIDSPDLSAPVPKDSPFALTFHLATELARAPGPQPSPTRNPGSTWQRSLHEVLQFFAPERVAHAHGAPFNGPAYYLVITDADEKQKLQVFTTNTFFTPEAVDWQNLVQAHQPLKLEISSAIFDENNIPEKGGPFVGGSFPFRIE